MTFTTLAFVLMQYVKVCKNISLKALKEQFSKIAEAVDIENFAVSDSKSVYFSTKIRVIYIKFSRIQNIFL